ncbi:hypothetical protein DAPPUDRAFT_117347 [Daphnia pulex]|uniref:Uncharacterized protein n=1 Tax=Daphnia pulex TaxID=6669 RepID=E9HSD2_DAPPU|nr:hypothetical protein DAPPUDRAFT_117347 [Daphnia pulex]|eukprot:EFX65349.1 hypothetical protein DAPPUDRAFT_117347 [Daphnia pulex]
MVGEGKEGVVGTSTTELAGMETLPKNYTVRQPGESNGTMTSTLGRPRLETPTMNVMSDLAGQPHQLQHLQQLQQLQKQMAGVNNNKSRAAETGTGWRVKLWRKMTGRSAGDSASDYCQDPYMGGVDHSDDISAVYAELNSVAGSTGVHRPSPIYHLNTYSEIPAASAAAGLLFPGGHPSPEASAERRDLRERRIRAGAGRGPHGALGRRQQQQLQRLDAQQRLLLGPVQFGPERLAAPPAAAPAATMGDRKWAGWARRPSEGREREPRLVAQFAASPALLPPPAPRPPAPLPPPALEESAGAADDPCHPPRSDAHRPPGHSGQPADRAGSALPAGRGGRRPPPPPADGHLLARRSFCLDERRRVDGVVQTAAAAAAVATAAATSASLCLRRRSPGQSFARQRVATSRSRLRRRRRITGALLRPI